MSERKYETVVVYLPRWQWERMAKHFRVTESPDDEFYGAPWGYWAQEIEQALGNPRNVRNKPTTVGDAIVPVAPNAERAVDLAALESELEALGWRSLGIEHRELQFDRPDDPDRSGLIDDTGHVAFTFYDDWETVDVIRKHVSLNLDGTR